jgi:hypothetical protein
MEEQMHGAQWFCPSQMNKFPAINSFLTLELDYDSLTKSDIEWIGKYCPHVLEYLKFPPPNISKISYQNTLQSYTKRPKIMPKIRKILPTRN